MVFEIRQPTYSQKVMGWHFLAIEEMVSGARFYSEGLCYSEQVIQSPCTSIHCLKNGVIVVPTWLDCSVL